MLPSGAALTRRGWTLAGAATGLLIAGRLLGAPELTILGVITATLLVVAWLWVRSRKRVVRVVRTVRPTRVHVGGDARVDLEIDDPGGEDSPQLLLTDVFDGGRRATRFLVPALRRGQRARAAYRVPTSRRGRYALGPITLTATDPFGLARRSWAVGAADEVTICPRVHELRPAPGAPGRLRSASPFAVRFHAPAVDGDEFLTLREYEVGDDLRRIHWRSTARTGELVVREDEAQWQPRAVVLLDTRPGAHDDASFEAAVEAAASVVARLVRSVLPVEVITTDGRTLGATGTGHRHGVGVEALVMDELAVVEPGGPDNLAAVARPLRAATRRGLLVAIMGDLTKPAFDTIAALGATGAPLILVTTGATPTGPARRSGGVVTVDGSGDTFAQAWDAAMLTHAPVCTRGHPPMTMHRSALYAAAALAALTIAAALGLGRVFADGSFALPIIGAALLPHAVGLLARNRRWHGSVLTIVTVVVVLVYFALVIAPATTTYGIPGSGTIQTLATRLSDGWHVFRTGRAPVPVTDGVLLLCMLLTALVAATADALAFRSEATLAAVVPSLLLFVFASTLGTTDLRTVTTIGYAVVALVFLMLQHQSLLERHRSWCSGRRLGSQATLVNAAAVVGGVALLTGLVLAPALPGVDDGPLLDYRSFGGSNEQGPSNFRTLSPLVDIRARLTEQPDIELFKVDAPTRLYWRIAALDRFDGTVWGIESQARDVGEELGRKRPVGTVRQQFTITALDDQWLPAAYEPRATDLEAARIVPESSTLIAPQREITGLTYRVDSRVASVPTRQQILATSAAVPARLRSSLQLPDSFPQSVRARALRIVAGASSPYEKAERLQAFFLDGSFTYDLNGPSGSSSDAIVNFLRSRRGFCEQFAGAFAAMARAVGLPARVAVGFAPGTYVASQGEFSVRARDAHAWPEVWLAGLGWTQFEPTPAGAEPGQADQTAGQPARAGSTAPTTPTTATTPTSTPGRTNATSPIPRGEAQVEAGSPAGTSGSDGGRHWVVILAALVLAILVAIGWLIVRLARKVRRRTRRRRTTIPAHSVAGAWQDALERLTDAGLPPSDTLTPYEQADGYATRGAPEGATASLSDLAELYARAGWSQREPTEEDVAQAWSDADAVRDALAEGTSGRERVRRALRL